MSLRTAVRGIVLVAAGAAVTASVAALLSPGVRRAALGLISRTHEESDTADQPTHIVLPDRVAPTRTWDEEVDEAFDGGHGAVSGEIALTGS